MLCFFEGSFSFDMLNWVDYVMLGIVLVGIIIGAKRGFMDQLFALVGTFGAFMGAILLCKVVGKLMGTDGIIFDKISEFLNGKFSTDAGKLIYNQPLDWSDKSNVDAALGIMGIPSFLSGIFLKMFAKFSPDGQKAVLADVLPVSLTELVNCAIAFIVLLIVLAIVIAILKKVLLKAVKAPGIKTVDTLLGLILGAVFAVLLMVVVCLVATALATIIPKLLDFVNDTVYQSYFGKFLQKLVEWISGFVGGFLSL